MSNMLEVDKQLTNDDTNSSINNLIESKPKLKVGLIMPISNTDGYPSGHWQDVRRIIEEAVSEIENFETTVSMVSEAEDTTLIQKTIVQRIYGDDIVIVDVSSKNPNVMFELGIRLAFDKPFLLLKDNMTDYVFDIHSIHHINYPKDLRYSDVIEVKKKIKSKLMAIYVKSQGEESMYLKDFGTYKVANLETQEIPIMEYMQKMLNEIKMEVNKVKIESSNNYITSFSNEKKSWVNNYYEKKKIVKKRVYELIENFVNKVDILSEFPNYLDFEEEILMRIYTDKELAQLIENMDITSIISDCLAEMGYSVSKWLQSS